MVDFFTTEEEGQVIAAIKEAERQTSGEIRVHLQKRIKTDVLAAAARTFYLMKMEETDQRNGVLIYIVPSIHQFAIIGDKGINEKVPKDFWQAVRDVMQQHFRTGKFADGVCAGVQLAGEKLRDFFPWEEGDKNELPDDISYG